MASLSLTGATQIGESNVGQNIGGQTGEIYAGKIGNVLNFKTLQSSDNSVTITNNADNVNLTIPPVIVPEILNDLTDVTVTAPTADQILQFDGAGQWRNVDLVIPPAPVDSKTGVGLLKTNNDPPLNGEWRDTTGGIYISKNYPNGDPNPYVANLNIGDELLFTQRDYDFDNRARTSRYILQDPPLPHPTDVNSLWLICQIIENDVIPPDETMLVVHRHSLNHSVHTVDPTPNDDEQDKYVVGHQWVNTTNGKVWISVFDNNSSAVWKEVTNVIQLDNHRGFQYRYRTGLADPANGEFSFSGGILKISKIDNQSKDRGGHFAIARPYSQFVFDDNTPSTGKFFRLALQNGTVDGTGSFYTFNSVFGSIQVDLVDDDVLYLTIDDSGCVQLNQLTDTAITAPAQGHILEYNNTTSKWENVAPTVTVEKHRGFEYVYKSGWAIPTEGQFYISSVPGNSSFRISKTDNQLHNLGYNILAGEFGFWEFQDNNPSTDKYTKIWRSTAPWSDEGTYIEVTGMPTISAGTLVDGDIVYLTIDNGGASTIQQLTDVAFMPSIPEGNVLTYTSGQWNHAPPATGGASTLFELTDVGPLYTYESITTASPAPVTRYRSDTIPTGSILAGSWQDSIDNGRAITRVVSAPNGGDFGINSRRMIDCNEASEFEIRISPIAAATGWTYLIAFQDFASSADGAMVMHVSSTPNAWGTFTPAVYAQNTDGNSTLFGYYDGAPTTMGFALTTNFQTNSVGKVVVMAITGQPSGNCKVFIDGVKVDERPFTANFVTGNYIILGGAGGFPTNLNAVIKVGEVICWDAPISDSAITGISSTLLEYFNNLSQVSDKHVISYNSASNQWVPKALDITDINGFPEDRVTYGWEYESVAYSAPSHSDGQFKYNSSIKQLNIFHTSVNFTNIKPIIEGTGGNPDIIANCAVFTLRKIGDDSKYIQFRMLPTSTKTVSTSFTWIENFEILHDTVVTSVDNERYIVSITFDGFDTLAKLKDTDISGVVDGQHLIYNNSLGKWINQTPLVIPDTSSGHLLTYNGSTIPTVAGQFAINGSTLYISTTSLGSNINTFLSNGTVFNVSHATSTVGRNAQIYMTKTSAVSTAAPNFVITNVGISGGDLVNGDICRVHINYQHANTIALLTDTNADAPADNQYLRWSGLSSKWEPYTRSRCCIYSLPVPVEIINLATATILQRVAPTTLLRAASGNFGMSSNGVIRNNGSISKWCRVACGVSMVCSNNDDTHILAIEVQNVSGVQVEIIEPKFRQNIHSDRPATINLETHILLHSGYGVNMMLANEERSAATAVFINSYITVEEL